MSQSHRQRRESASESDLESGEEREEEVAGSPQSTTATAKNPFNQTALDKRRRGNVWKNVVLEDDLASSLSKVSTRTAEESKKPRDFIDLDSPSTSADVFAVPHPHVPMRPSAGRGRSGKRNRSGRGRPASNAPTWPVVSSSGENKAAATSADLTGAPRIGEKRKNIMKPKPKRTTSSKSTDHLEPKTTYFSVFPDLKEEVLDTDRLDIACRKACKQLKEDWNPWTITKIVTHLGNAETRKLLQLTKTIEHSGGMLTKDGKRRRSPGGVFIQLFKSDAEPKIGVEALKKILAPAPGSAIELDRAEKRKRNVALRAERRAAAAANAPAKMDTDVVEVAAPIQSTETSTDTTPAVDESTTNTNSMDVDSGTSQIV